MSQKFAIRLSVEGAQQAGDALKGVPEKAAQGVKTLGDTSDRTAQRMRGLRADTSSVTPAMKGLDTVAGDLRRGFDGIAGRVPVIGGALQALGPAGLAAAAGITAIGAALGAMWQMGQKSREYLDDIATQAANIGTSAETFQALTALATEQDVEFSKLAESMGKLQLGAALAAKGQGELFTTLKRVKPELVDMIVKAETQEDRWDALSRAISGTESQLDKVAIAKAAFGESGAKLIRLLDGEDKSIGALTAKYKELGVVIGEDMVAAVAAADTRLDMANRKMEVDGVRAGAAMLPVIESLTGAWNDAWRALGNYIDGYNQLPEQQLGTLMDRQADLVRQRGKILEGLAGNLGMGNEAVRNAFRIDAQNLLLEINAIDAELIRRRRALQPQKGAVSIGTTVEDPAEAASAAAAANKAATDAARARADAERELAKALGEQQAAQARVNAILDASKTPVQRAYDELDALTSLYATHGEALIGYADAYTAVLGKIAEAEAAEARVANAMEKSRKAIDAQSASLGRSREAHDDAREASFELRFAAEAIGGVFDQQIESLEDLGMVAMRVFRNMAIEAILAQSQIAGSGLMEILSAGFGFMFGGSPAAASTGGIGGFKNGAPGGGAGGFKNAGVHHLGGVAGFALQSRMVPESVFHDAPRNHRGYPLAADERAAILQVGEPVVAKWDANRIMRAVENAGSGGGNVSIAIHNETGGRVETRETKRGDGGRDVQIFIRKAVGGMIAAGEFDEPMAARYGASRKLSG